MASIIRRLTSIICVGGADISVYDAKFYVRDVKFPVSVARSKKYEGLLGL
ncbi:MAG: hypothetical protein LBJ67_03825 [Planctomycetaceae bacterium]|nr:hypothetical protein [Planctomycetaceae bacterium]